MGCPVEVDLRLKLSHLPIDLQIIIIIIRITFVMN